MGVQKNIAYNEFPRQSTFIGRPVEVVFNYDTEHVLPGRIVRDDQEDPGVMIIRLGEDGQEPKYILATECQYRFKS